MGWESIVKADGEGAYLDLFWIDAHEQRGVIYLMGKAAIGEGRFVSCCCIVRNVLQTLLVLPRITGAPTADGKPMRHETGVWSQDRSMCNSLVARPCSRPSLRERVISQNL